MAGQLEALKKNVWQNDELSATYQPGNLAHENTWEASLHQMMVLLLL